MEEASGVSKRDLQRELRSRGVRHKPDGLKPLPWNPLDLSLACIGGAVGASTLMTHTVQSMMQRVPLLGAIKTGMVPGCITASVIYTVASF